MVVYDVNVDVADQDVDVDMAVWNVDDHVARCEEGGDKLGCFLFLFSFEWSQKSQTTFKRPPMFFGVNGSY